MGVDKLEPRVIQDRNGKTTTVYVKSDRSRLKRNAVIGIAAAAVPLSAIGLAGCAPTHDADQNSPDPQITTSQGVNGTTAPSPTATITPQQLVNQALGGTNGGKDNGAKITADQADALRSTSKTHSAYQLKSGDWVITDRSKPLPPAVTKDLDSRATSTLKSNGGTVTDPTGRQGTSSTIQQLAGDDSAQRTVISLVHGSSGIPDSFPAAYHRVWLLNGLGGNGEVVASKAAGLAKANAFIKAQSNPDAYVLVVAE